MGGQARRTMMYVCGLCGQECGPNGDWNDETALAEMRTKFGDVPPDERAVQCDSCHLWALDVERIARALAAREFSNPDMFCLMTDPKTNISERQPIWVAYIEVAKRLTKLPGPETRVQND